MSKRQRDRQAAQDAAMHWHAIQRAKVLTDDEVAQAALVRLGPVPATCQQCDSRPPRNFMMHGAGQWLCNVCAGLEPRP